jgi:hypothetical protein
LRASDVAVAGLERPTKVDRARRRPDKIVTRRLAIASTFVLLGGLLISTPTSGESSPKVNLKSTGTSAAPVVMVPNARDVQIQKPEFSFNWTGTPDVPLKVVPNTWDVQIHKRDVGDSMEPMETQHGADCAAPPATHPINMLAQGVFICKNHLMTAIGDSGYGEIALTSNHMADWSSGTTAIKIDIRLGRGLGVTLRQQHSPAIVFH